MVDHAKMFHHIILVWFTAEDFGAPVAQWVSSTHAAVSILHFAPVARLNAYLELHVGDMRLLARKLSEGFADTGLEQKPASQMAGEGG